MRKVMIAALVGAAALAAAGSASADAPTAVRNVLQLGPLVDDETCAFPLTFSVDRVRTTTTFENGDVRRKVDLTVTQTANGHTAVESDVWNVFIDHADPANWKLTGRFGQIFLDGRLIYLQSGLIGYDPFTDVLSDAHPGPAGTYPDVCAILAA
jgi:hypothetical protein